MPPTDPRFLDASDADMIIDLWAHRHADNPQLRESPPDTDFEETLRAMGLDEDADDSGGADFDDVDVSYNKD